MKHSQGRLAGIQWIQHRVRGKCQCVCFYHRVYYLWPTIVFKNMRKEFPDELFWHKSVSFGPTSTTFPQMQQNFTVAFCNGLKWKVILMFQHLTRKVWHHLPTASPNCFVFFNPDQGTQLKLLDFIFPTYPLRKSVEKISYEVMLLACSQSGWIMIEGRYFYKVNSSFFLNPPLFLSSSRNYDLWVVVMTDLRA